MKVRVLGRRRRRRRAVAAEGVVALEGVGGDVVDVDVARPAAMSWLAKPMIWPYLRTGSPFLIGRRATLWPEPIAAGDGDGAAVELQRPCRRGSACAATATLSSGRRWTATCDSGTAGIGGPFGERRDVFSLPERGRRM